MIQQVINRMASSSAAAKGWLLPVVAATYGFAFEQSSVSVAIVGLVAVIVFAFLDANYLTRELEFRELHRTVARGAVLPPFSMRASDIGKEADDDGMVKRRWWPTWRAWLSWSIAPFYLAMAALGVVAICVSLTGGSPAPPEP
jgi:histidine triad (HIT) family protein